ncbi:uncharacterized protein GGS22DRAFT_186018 [Annulohypoxylon maeteangense]|uniref:uncharacterized protein n=1 Tax=Annulohypoxylon maeteangense TaxID=1927788 RepID=UPI002007AD53|nr:uncharacterized protein GGS22DRAFT_186018 [Annulohypoxylon maeteangense]KAI0887182.1 hypothetical protein GGS22DRAFT_186018 [Annulohypoxylon maeteangense]
MSTAIIVCLSFAAVALVATTMVATIHCRRSRSGASSGSVFDAEEALELRDIDRFLNPGEEFPARDNARSVWQPELPRFPEPTLPPLGSFEDLGIEYMLAREASASGNRSNQSLPSVSTPSGLSTRPPTPFPAFT